MDNLLLRAAQFAKKAHDGQRRKYTNRPYIEHPARVAARAMMLEPLDAELVAAAWLHDVIEDCSVSAEGLLDAGFPSQTVMLVVELTDPKGGDAPRAQRKHTDRDRIRRLSRNARRIKAIDRADNLGELAGAKEGFISLYCAESVLLATCLGRDIEPHLVDDIYQAVTALGFSRAHADSRTQWPPQK